VHIIGEGAKKDALSVRNSSLVEYAMMKKNTIMNGMLRKHIRWIDSKLKRLDVSTAPMFRNHNRIARSAKFNLRDISVPSAICLMRIIKKKRSTTAMGVEYAELVGEISHSIATNVNVALILSIKMIIRVLLLSRTAQCACRTCTIPDLR